MITQILQVLWRAMATKSTANNTRTKTYVIIIKYRKLPRGDALIILGKGHLPGTTRKINYGAIIELFAMPNFYLQIFFEGGTPESQLIVARTKLLRRLSPE